MHTRTYRNRHGRGIRGPVLPSALPKYRSRSSVFDAGVVEAYAPIIARFPSELAGLDVAVDTVPRMRLRADASFLSDEIVADGPVPLGRVIPAGVDSRGMPTRARLVIFRMPIEQRATNVSERQSMLRYVLAHLIASYLNVDPTDIDPDCDGEI